jgi:hypothetical protein
MEEHKNFPDINQLSIISAVILLTYASSPSIKIPEQVLSFVFLGTLFNFRFNVSMGISLLTALLAAVGTVWIISDHPKQTNQNFVTHSLLPAFTALILGIPLSTIGVGMAWWAVFILGSIFLIMILVAEYISIDQSDENYAPAVMGLTAVSFALFLILAITVHAAELRLYLSIPLLTGAMFLVCLRTFHLHLDGKWHLLKSAAIALIIGQIAAGINYWPLSSVSFGLVLMGLVYALPTLIWNISLKRSLKSALIESGGMLLIMWALAIVI